VVVAPAFFKTMRFVWMKKFFKLSEETDAMDAITDESDVVDVSQKFFRKNALTLENTISIGLYSGLYGGMKSGRARFECRLSTTRFE